jgi:hypothetical protein
MSRRHAAWVGHVIHTLITAWTHLDVLVRYLAELVGLSVVQRHLVASWKLLNKFQLS